MTLITLTDAAANHIKNKIANDKDKMGFRLSIKKTGCSGYAYRTELVNRINENDIHFVVNDDLHIFIDPACEPFVKGLILDYVVETSHLKQKKLVFINPNEKNRCGCGESFTIE